MAPSILINNRHNYDSHHYRSDKPTTNWFLCCFGCSSVDRSKNRVVNQSHPEEGRGSSCIGNDRGSSSNTDSQKKKKKRTTKKKFKYLKFVYWPVCRIRRAMKNPSKKMNKVDDNDQLLHTRTGDGKGNNYYEIVEVPDIDHYDLVQASRMIHTVPPSSLGVSVAGTANQSPTKLSRIHPMKNNRADRQTIIVSDSQHTVATNPPDKRKCKDWSGSQKRIRRSTSNKFPYSDGDGGIDRHPVIGMSILAVALVIMVSCGPLFAILCTSACFYCIPWLVKVDNGINMVYGRTACDTNNNNQRDDKSSGLDIIKFRVVQQETGV